MNTTIIIPAKNCLEVLKLCITSVPQQDRCISLIGADIIKEGHELLLEFIACELNY